MTITLFRRLGRYCDYLDMYHEIKIRVQKKQFVGQPNPIYIPTAFECAHANKCQRSNDCPLWPKARKMII